MRGFNFKFDKVLRVREIREDKALNRFQECRRKMSRVEKDLEKKKNKRKRIHEYIRNRNDISPDFMTVVRRYLEINKEKIDKLKVELTELRQKLKKKKQAYINCRKKREIMDKMKENNREERVKELLSREQKELDEIGQQIREVH